MKHKYFLSLLLGFMVASAPLFAQKTEKSKLLVGKWKLIKELENGKEVKPKHDKLIIEFSRKGEFTITAAYEETHNGTWEMNEDETKVLMTDIDSGEEMILFVEKSDKYHLDLGNFDGPLTTIAMVPLGKTKAQHLNHKEHMVAKKWHVFKSDNPDNMGALFEFKPDHTFIILPEGFKVPVFTGKWKLSDDHKTLLVDRREDGEHMELDIEDLHTHEMTLKNHETGRINIFHDRKLTKKDQERAVIESGKLIEEGK